MPKPKLAVVDYGMGNLYNVERACTRVGLSATVTDDPNVVCDADLAILPGVGAMKDAMAELDRTGLSDALRERAAASRPIFGVCLGLQLLMSNGTEFGEHPGLGIIPGRVVRFPDVDIHDAILRVPHIGWSAVNRNPARPASWDRSPLSALHDGDLQYFVHSYHVVPDDPDAVAAISHYGGIDFCSALMLGSVFACQFHPERSGPDGLGIYEAISHVGAHFGVHT